MKYNVLHAGGGGGRVGGRRGRTRRRRTLELEKMKKLTRAFLREDRARGKRWRLENHCERAAKCPGRVPSASGGHSGWVFRRLTVPDQKMTEGKSVGDVPTDVFQLKKISGAGGGRRPNGRAGGHQCETGELGINSSGSMRIYQK